MKHPASFPQCHLAPLSLLPFDPPTPKHRHHPSRQLWNLIRHQRANLSPGSWLPLHPQNQGFTSSLLSREGLQMPHEWGKRRRHGPLWAIWSPGRAMLMSPPLTLQIPTHTHDLATLLPSASGLRVQSSLQQAQRASSLDLICVDRTNAQA